MEIAFKQSSGWTVLRLWECELKKANANKTLERIRLALGKDGTI
jgi:G:T-mismatch repair DNA endonuclease (very short patch repair protein)